VFVNLMNEKPTFIAPVIKDMHQADYGRLYDAVVLVDVLPQAIVAGMVLHDDTSTEFNGDSLKKAKCCPAFRLLVHRAIGQAGLDPEHLSDLSPGAMSNLCEVLGTSSILTANVLAAVNDIDEHVDMGFTHDGSMHDFDGSRPPTLTSNGIGLSSAPKVAGVLRHSGGCCRLLGLQAFSHDGQDHYLLRTSVVKPNWDQGKPRDKWLVAGTCLESYQTFLDARQELVASNWMESLKVEAGVCLQPAHVTDPGAYTYNAGGGALQCTRTYKQVRDTVSSLQEDASEADTTTGKVYLACDCGKKLDVTNKNKVCADTVLALCCAVLCGARLMCW
jgi:hypothetical protein